MKNSKNHGYHLTKNSRNIVVATINKEIGRILLNKGINNRQMGFKFKIVDPHIDFLMMMISGHIIKNNQNNIIYV